MKIKKKANRKMMIGRNARVVIEYHLYMMADADIESRWHLPEFTIICRSIKEATQATLSPNND